MANSFIFDKDSKLYKLFTVLVGALLMGFLWRVRGTHGWGSSWGLLNVGFIYTVFIICVKGGRKKLRLGWLTTTAVAFMLTTPAWGTLLDQITGQLNFTLNYTPVVAAEVSAFSAVFFMLCMGFGLAVLFGLLLGRAYSDVGWKLWHFVAILAAFYAVDLLSKAFISHWVIDLVQPQAKEVFEQGLQAAGESGTAWQSYMSHFADASWAKKIYGGRNYFASVQAIASMLRAVAAILTVRFVVKDKRSAGVGLAVCGAFAFAITVSDLFFFFSNGGWHGEQGFSLPKNIPAWPMWEYATGFIAGLIITALLVSIDEREDVYDSFRGEVPSVLVEMFTFIFGNIVLIGVNVVRPIMVRFDNSMHQVFHTIIATVVAVAMIAFMSKKFGINVNKAKMEKYAASMLIIAVLYVFLAYMFFGTKTYVAYREIETLPNTLCVVSFAVVFIWGMINHLCFLKKKV